MDRLGKLRNLKYLSCMKLSECGWFWTFGESVAEKALKNRCGK